jgi:hypothetical protein
LRVAVSSIIYRRVPPNVGEGWVSLRRLTDYTDYLLKC